MIDRDIGGRDKHRLGVRQHVEAIFPVVVAHAGRPDAPERHCLDEQMDIYLVDRAAAKRQFADEAVDRLLLSAEDEGCKRMRGCGNSVEGLVQTLLGQDGQDRPEDLVFHDGIIPCDRIDDRRIEVVRGRIGSAADDYLRGVDQASKAGDLVRADDA
jgi:hypothetical protein